MYVKHTDKFTKYINQQYPFECVRSQILLPLSLDEWKQLNSFFLHYLESEYSVDINTVNFKEYNKILSSLFLSILNEIKTYIISLEYNDVEEQENFISNNINKLMCNLFIDFLHYSCKVTGKSKNTEEKIIHRLSTYYKSLKYDDLEFYISIITEKENFLSNVEHIINRNFILNKNYAFTLSEQQQLFREIRFSVKRLALFLYRLIYTLSNPIYYKGEQRIYNLYKNNDNLVFIGSKENKVTDILNSLDNNNTTNLNSLSFN